MVRELAAAGFVHFAEPCIPECHLGKEECAKCKRDVGFKEVQYGRDSQKKFYYTLCCRIEFAVQNYDPPLSLTECGQCAGKQHNDIVYMIGYCYTMVLWFLTLVDQSVVGCGALQHGSRSKCDPNAVSKGKRGFLNQ